MATTQQWTKRFFWLAFAAFLSASIPHVAYFFRAYEPAATGMWDTGYWVISFAIAASIDVTIFLLSLTVANMRHQRKSNWLVFSVWLFIIGLAVLSWYINWVYAKQFTSASMFNHAPTVQLPYVGDINPLIASCFQALAIAYTWISDKIATDSKPKSAAELEAEATELEAKLKANSRLIAAKSAQRKARFGAFVGDIKEMVAEVKSPQTTAQPAPDLSAAPEIETPEIAANPEQAEVPIEAETTPELMEATPDTLPSIEATEEASQAKRGPYYMTYEEASVYTGYSVSYLKGKVTTGEIEASSNGKKLKVSTLKVKGQTTGKFHALKLVKEA